MKPPITPSSVEQPRQGSEVMLRESLRNLNQDFIRLNSQYSELVKALQAKVFQIKAEAKIGQDKARELSDQARLVVIRNAGQARPPAAEPVDYSSVEISPARQAALRIAESYVDQFKYVTEEMNETNTRIGSASETDMLTFIDNYREKFNEMQEALPKLQAALEAEE